MEIVSFRRPDNPFEQRVLAKLGAGPLSGIVTNNVLIPHVTFRNLPNEHDILVLLEGRIVTLDTKDLQPGAYREGSAGWEHKPPQREWTPVTFMGHPREVAFKKAKVLEGYIHSLCVPGVDIPKPQVVSCIVVPDHCDVTALPFRADGRMQTGARLILARLSDLIDVLANDVAAERQRRPTVAELSELLSFRRGYCGNTYACKLAADLEIYERLSRNERPIVYETYRGEDLTFRRAVRVDICPLYSSGEHVDAVLRAYRNNVIALQNLRHDAIPRLYQHAVTPMAIVMVYEYFSNHTLLDELDIHRLTWAEVTEIFRPVVEALRQAHCVGIAHRYLDPSCILLSEGRPRHVRVLGFFGAMISGYSTVGADDAGDPYSAPERGDGGGRTPLQDAYSVGRCIIASMTGDPNVLPPSSLIPAGVGDLIEQLVARESSARELAWERLPTALRDSLR